MAPGSVLGQSPNTMQTSLALWTVCFAFCALGGACSNPPGTQPAAEAASEPPDNDEQSLDDRAIAEAQLSEAQLEQTVQLQPNPAVEALSADPAPFTIRQQIVDQRRLVDARPLADAALHRLIRGNQYTFRALACDRAGEQRAWDLIGVLIDALSDESMHVGANYGGNSGDWTTRRRCQRALQRITSLDHGFAWNGTREQRALAIGRWVAWFHREHP